jgi:uncharacterized protein
MLTARVEVADRQPSGIAGVRPEGRLEHLDMLRGLALFGMLVVHLSWYTTGGGVVAENVERVVQWAFSTKFFALFAFLFGIGFAIQLESANRRGENFLPRYARRLAALGVLGIALKFLMGYRVLFLYALWGFALLAVRRARAPLLVAGVAASAFGTAMWDAGNAAWQLYAAGGSTVEAERVLVAKARGREEVFAEGERHEETATYGGVVRARVEMFIADVRRPRWWIPRMQPFGFFLLGLLAVRHGVVHDPQRHRRTIVNAMVAGGAVTLISIALYKLDIVTRTAPAYYGTEQVVRELVAAVHTQYFVFVYIGVAVLWLQRVLSPLAWAGRMALTNYIVQLLFLELVLGRHGLGLALHTAWIPLFAIAFTAFHVLSSRLWLRYFRYGPLEWVWRMVTYMRREPMRRSRVNALSPAS